MEELQGLVKAAVIEYAKAILSKTKSKEELDALAQQTSSLVFMYREMRESDIW